jgi:hypothetical protein
MPRNVLTALFLIPLAGFQLGALDVDERLLNLMGEDAYTSSGMDKLSGAEKAVLLDWLKARDLVIEEQTRDEATAEVERQMEQRFEQEVATRIKEEKEREAAEKKKRSLELFGFMKPDPDMEIVIESRIQGRFTGWLGNSSFYLTNGQVWKQRGGGKYYFPLDDPKVVIRKEKLGYWMTVEETGARVGVERVK